MTGIEKITARIEAEAVADASRIAEETKGKCDSLRDEGDKKAQERYWQCLREGVKKTEERVRLLEKTADMESRKSLLTFKQGLVDEAFQKAEEKLRALPDGGYGSFLVNQAVKASVTGDEEIILNRQDRATYGSAVLSRANSGLAGAGKTGNLTLSDETGDFSGGLILRKGNITVNCTVEALMLQARQEQCALVVADLFGNL